jgi:hypothetical protein
MGKNGDKRRERGRDPNAWDQDAKTWKAATYAAGGARLGESGAAALARFLGECGGNASLMVLGMEQHQGANPTCATAAAAAPSTSPGKPVFPDGPVPPTPGRLLLADEDAAEPEAQHRVGAAGMPKKCSEVFEMDDPAPSAVGAGISDAHATQGAAAGVEAVEAGPLRKVRSEAEMLQVVQLCKDAFDARGIEMDEAEFWTYDAQPEAQPDCVEALPYLEAPRHHALFPERGYYLYTAAGERAPTAAIVMDAPDDAVWVVPIMGSTRPGHGRRALAALATMAFAGRCAFNRPIFLCAVLQCSVEEFLTGGGSAGRGTAQSRSRPCAAGTRAAGRSWASTSAAGSRTAATPTSRTRGRPPTTRPVNLRREPAPRRRTPSPA